MSKYSSPDVVFGVEVGISLKVNSSFNFDINFAPIFNLAKSKLTFSGRSNLTSVCSWVIDSVINGLGSYSLYLVSIHTTLKCSLVGKKGFGCISGES